MADSLVIANSLELMGGSGGEYCTLPGLENTIFALNDQNTAFDLGTHQPTVDILASLITDGERPIGRRSSNRTLSIPIAIMSDTRDNLTLARETLFQMVDAQETEQWTLTYTRDSTDSTMSCPMILNCWRSKPMTVSYNQPAENQFVYEVVVNCDALPYARSDTPNTVTYYNPASGNVPPPSPLALDTFSVIPAGQVSTWNVVNYGAAGAPSSAYCPSGSTNPQVTNPYYFNMGLGGLDFTAATGSPQLNVFQFWAGFASQRFYNNWANHKSEVRFLVTLFDENGNTVTNSRQYTVHESNNLARPEWMLASVRLPVNNQNFDWTNVVGYSIKVQNFHDSLFHNSNVFLSLAYAVAPSGALANQTRGSIYRLNGIEGTVHTTVNFTVQQQPSSTPTVAQLTNGQSFTPPGGVVNALAELIGPGGSGGSAVATSYAGGGGGGEYVRAPSVALTPGQQYSPAVPAGQQPLKLGAFSGFTQYGSYNNAGPVSSPTFAPSSNTTAGMTLILIISAAGLTGAPSAVSDPVNGNWTWMQDIIGVNGVWGYAYVMFNSATIPTSDVITITGLTTTGAVEVALMGAAGIAGFNRPPVKSYSGTSQFPRCDVNGFTNPNASTQGGLTNWSVVGSSSSSLTVNSSPPGTSPYPKCLTAVSTSSADTPGMVSAIIAVNNNENILPKALCYLPTQSSMIVQLIINWYADSAGATLISSTNDNVTLTASTWQWANGTSHAVPSGASYYTVQVQQATSTANNPLQIASCGGVYTTAIDLVELGVLINNSGLNSSTSSTPGWTHDYGTSAETPLCMDIFHSHSFNASGVGGDVVAGSYSSSVPWAAMTMNLSLIAGTTVFTADDQNLIAVGGASVPISVSTGGVGGSGGTDNALAPQIQNDGGNGANGTSPSGGGGAGGGGIGSSVWTDDTNAAFVYSQHTAPAVCMSPLPVRTKRVVAGHGGSCTLYGGDILQYGAGPLDTIIVMFLTNGTATPEIAPTDSQGNKYVYLKTNNLADGTKAQVFYSNKNTGAFTPLTPGSDYIGALSTTNSDSYLILAYAWRNAIVFATSGYESQSSFTGTTGSMTVSGMSETNAGSLVFTIAQDGNETTAQSPMVPVDDENVGTNWGSLYANPGFNSNMIIDSWWRNNGGSAVTYTFNRAVSGTVQVDALTVDADAPSGWLTGGTLSSFFNETHHYTNQGGNMATITFNGPRCLLMGLIGPNQGQAWVNLDGGAWTLMDNYSANPQPQSVIYDTGSVSNGTHVITVLVLGRQNVSSTNAFIDLDAYQVMTGGAGPNGVLGVGGAANPPMAGAGATGGVNANGGTGGTGAGGSGASSTSGTKIGGIGGKGQVNLTYFQALPAFKTAILHRPSLDGSATLMPYISCSSQTPPTNDLVQSLETGVSAHFNGTYTMMVAGSTWNTPANSRTVTVTVNEYEYPGSSVTATSSCSLTFTPNSPPPGMGNNIFTIGELSLPSKAIPSDNNQAVYYVSVNSSNSSDRIQDVIMLDTMGQTIYINDSLSYAQFFVDEPTPDVDIGLVLGSKYDRPYAISVLDSAFPSGGPLTVEPGDNVLFAYCYEGAPALVCNYFPRYYIDRTAS